MAQQVLWERLIFVDSSAQLSCSTPDCADGWHVKEERLFRVSQLYSP